LLKTWSDFSLNFLQFWDEGKSFDYHHGDYKFHTVFLTFGPRSHELPKKVGSSQKREFCTIINLLVSKGGDFENAVSTCFLEHASQLAVREFIEPYLSKEAKREVR